MPFIIRTVCGVAGTVDDGFTACVCSACAIGHGLPIAEASSLGAAVPPPKWWQQIRRYELCRNAARPRGTCLRYSLLSCHVVAHRWKWLAPAAEPSPVVMWRWSFNRRATKAAANGGARCFELCSCTALWGHTPRPLLARQQAVRLVLVLVYGRTISTGHISMGTQHEVNRIGRYGSFYACASGGFSGHA